jgi:hypothetical protein
MVLLLLLLLLLQQTGAHLYETCPSGNYFEYKAQAIGARAQSARTYLEKKFPEFEDCTRSNALSAFVLLSPNHQLFVAGGRGRARFSLGKRHAC